MGRPRSCECGECAKCKHRLYMQSWYADKPEYATDQGRKHRERAREYERRRYHEDAGFREKKMARNMVGIRLQRGTLQRQPCERCGTPNAQAHHEDYSRPLDITWLCKEHHAERHREIDDEHRERAA